MYRSVEVRIAARSYVDFHKIDRGQLPLGRIASELHTTVPLFLAQALALHWHYNANAMGCPY